MNIVVVRFLTSSKPYAFRVPNEVLLKEGDLVKTGTNSGAVAICVTDSEEVSDNVANMITTMGQISGITSELIGAYKLIDW